MFPRTTALHVATVALALSAFRLFAADDGVDFFEKKVRPLLAKRCLECHSAEKKIKGSLRLDARDGWAKGGDSGPAVEPGKPEESLLIEAVRYGNHDLQMPPKRKLAAEEIAIFEQWVKMGAPDPRVGAAAEKKQTGLSIAEGRKFWCYTPIRKPVVATVKDESWPRGDIDRFILTGIEAAGTRPAPDAAPEALARRIYFNLIGLPPTPEQVDAFVATDRQDRRRAVEQLVDQLLATPQFAETWARHWLDVARFAESSGGGRTLLFKDAWRFRDYVIDALNHDEPFDQFIREQLAGDLLSASTPAERRRQITATGFLALGPTNYEEQEKQQLRYDVIDEQLDTIGRAFLGQTIGCARCHDHKFDPIPQRDYYAMAGIFASTRTLSSYKENVTKWVAAQLPDDETRETALREHETKVEALEKEIASAKAALTERSKALSEATAAPGLPVAAAELPGIVVDDSDAKVVGMWKHSRFVRSYVGDGYLTDDNTGKGEKTITFTPAVPASGRYEVRLAYTHLNNRATNVHVTVFHADGEDTVYVDETLTPPIDGRFVSLGKFRFEKDGAGYVLISNEGTTGYVTIDALQFLPEESSALPAGKMDPAASRDITAAGKRVKELEAKLAKLKKDGPARDTAMAVRDDEEIVDAQIRIRGVEKQRGERAPRGFLQVAWLQEAPPALPSTESGRRQFADWIASADNPLTARVFANRAWTWLFGAGIVRTVDNFGTTGERPSHPELLDYLATRFIEEGWSVKKLVREIVLSRTWQQAVSAPSARDPENRLFARANRRRLDADQIRDALLAASGQLSLEVGGPNITGAGDIDPNNFSAQNIEYAYVFADTRRSVYTPAFRNKRLELFEAFDFGNINQPVGQRDVSTVAPQALYLLNSPFVAEQARAAAERTLALESDNSGRIVAAFRRALGRGPSDAELAKCRRFLAASSAPAAEKWAQLHQALFASIDFRYLH